MQLPFVILCGGCSAKIKINKESLVGKKVRCPKCHQPVVVSPPATERPPSSAPKAQSQQKVTPRRKKPAPKRASAVPEEVLIDDYGDDYLDDHGFDDGFGGGLPGDPASLARRPQPSPSPSARTGQSGRPTWQIPALLGGGLFLLLTVGVVVVLVVMSGNSDIGMRFVSIPAGTFTMGDANGRANETPHEVTLTQPFELGMYEVTQDQYNRVMGTNPSYFKGGQNPVEQVSWADAVEFCRVLSELPEEKAAGHVYRLPTEAEWEYACRAGTTTAYSFGDSESELGEYAWYGDNSSYTTHPVGEKLPNAWGLYDMHGNVWEWCQDWHGDDPSGAETDPPGPASGSDRVSRGGGWDSGAELCESAFRSRNWPYLRFNYFLGFRVARSSVK